jgi:hypothetical protein
MGNFEWVEFGSEITVDNETDLPGADAKKLTRFADDYLEKSLAADIEEARQNTAEDASYIHLYKQES